MSRLSIYSRRPSNSMKAFQWRRKVSKKVCIEMWSLYYLCIKLVVSSLCAVRVSCVGELSAHGGRVRQLEYAFFFSIGGCDFRISGCIFLDFLHIWSRKYRAPVATQVRNTRPHCASMNGGVLTSCKHLGSGQVAQSISCQVVAMVAHLMDADNDLIELP